MFAFASLVALASAALPQVFAHGGVLSYQIEGQIYQGWAVSPLSRFFLLLCSTDPPSGAFLAGALQTRTRD